MAIKDIIEKIRADGAAEVAATEARRDQNLASIKAEHDAIVTERETMAKTDRDRRAGKVAERILAKARHQVRFIFGTNEQNRLETVFAAVKDELLALTAGEYRNFLTKQFASIGKPSDGTFTVAHNRADETIEILLGLGVKLEAILRESENILLGGFVFSTSGQDHDCSFRGLLQLIRDRHTVDIAAKLIT